MKKMLKNVLPYAALVPLVVGGCQKQIKLENLVADKQSSDKQMSFYMKSKTGAGEAYFKITGPLFGGFHDKIYSISDYDPAQANQLIRVEDGNDVYLKNSAGEVVPMPLEENSPYLK